MQLVLLRAKCKNELQINIIANMKKVCHFILSLHSHAAFKFANLEVMLTRQAEGGLAQLFLVKRLDTATQDTACTLT